MRRRRISKPLERVARSIKNSDEFVAHIASIAERYRSEHALDAGLRNRGLRQSLQVFRRHAQALTEWLDLACGAGRPGTQADALSSMAGAVGRMPSEMRAGAKEVLDWLSQAEIAAARTLSDTKALSRKPQRNAPRIAAEGLRATLEHHQLKVSTAGSRERPSPAVSLLCAIAKGAGDATLTPAEARRIFVASGKKAS
jgi:hypothetical protein